MQTPSRVLLSCLAVSLLGACERGTTVPQDFSVTVGDLSMARGDSGTVTVSASTTGGFSAPIRLTLSGLPSGVTAVETTVQPGQATASIPVRSTFGAPQGSVTATLTASADGHEPRTADVTVAIQKPENKLFQDSLFFTIRGVAGGGTSQSCTVDNDTRIALIVEYVYGNSVEEDTAVVYNPGTATSRLISSTGNVQCPPNETREVGNYLYLPIDANGAFGTEWTRGQLTGSGSALKLDGTLFWAYSAPWVGELEIPFSLSLIEGAGNPRSGRSSTLVPLGSSGGLQDLTGMTRAIGVGSTLR